MLPWDFWRLTPAEFTAYAAAYRRREDRTWYRVAWQTASLLKPHLKRHARITPEKLLGWKANRDI